MQTMDPTSSIVKFVGDLASMHVRFVVLRKKDET